MSRTRTLGGQRRPEIPAGVRPGGAPVPGGVKVRRNRVAARLYLPALATFGATFWLGGGDGHALARAAAFAFVVYAVARILRDFPYPLRLMPASRIGLSLLPVASGFLAAAGLLLVGADGFSLAAVAPAFLMAAVVSVAVEVVADALVSARPLRIAVLGSADFVPAIRRELDAIGGRREIEVIGWLNIGSRHAVTDPSVRDETLNRIRATITEHDIDLLVRGPGAGSSRSGRDVYDTIAAGCLDLPVRMIDGNQLYEQIFGHVPIGTIDSAWFLFLMHPSFSGGSAISKRATDLVVGSLAAVVAMPLIALGALAIKIGDRGPVFYRQRRVGERGREFEILKLRTMRSDAQADGARWAAAADERITRVGKVLRRLHIDELPQIVNVLRGDMTLVGPRPEQPEITAELERVFPHYTRRLLVKPGVTGWAQVRCGYAGSQLGTAWKLCHDLFYLKHRSLLADLLIMLETLVIAARDSHRPMRAPQAGFLVAAGPPAAPDGVPASAGVPLDAEPEESKPLGGPVPAGVPLLG